LSRKLKPNPQFISNRQQAPRRQRERKALLFLWIIIPTIVALSLGLVGYWYYANHVAVWHQPVAKVNEKVIDMDYFVKSLRYDWLVLYGGGVDSSFIASQVLARVEEDELVRQGAEKLGVAVTADEVTQKIRDLLMPSAEGSDGEQPEMAFDDTYEQWLDLIKLADEEYRQIVETSLLRQKIAERLKESEVPKEGEQVLLHAIVVGSEGEALEVVTRIEGGDDFADLATELSLGEGSKENGGNQGWVPRGISYPELDEVAFALEVEVVSDPILVGQSYYVIKVSEKAQNRTIDDEHRNILLSVEFEKWLVAEREASTIEEYLDQDKIDWAVNKIVG